MAADVDGILSVLSGSILNTTASSSSTSQLVLATKENVTNNVPKILIPPNLYLPIWVPSINAQCINPLEYVISISNTHCSSSAFN
jgi:hypothetical protein